VQVGCTSNYGRKVCGRKRWKFCPCKFQATPPNAPFCGQSLSVSGVAFLRTRYFRLPASLTIPRIRARITAALLSILHSQSWACGAAGSALPWHGRGRRFDPDQVHQFKPPWNQSLFRSLRHWQKMPARIREGASCLPCLVARTAIPCESERQSEEFINA
jgi:hypothetical protein